MKDIINGIEYDTEKAKCLDWHWYGPDPQDGQGIFEMPDGNKFVYFSTPSNERITPIEP